MSNAKQTTAKPAHRKSSSSPATKHQEPALMCPRCDSPNTKFCYYNNYSLSQPRHFCKTCRRYWTRGGALRNVPVGGGCRKSKKIKCSDRDSDATDLGGLRFFQGISPAMDFHPNFNILQSPNPNPAMFGHFSNLLESSSAPSFSPFSSSGLKQVEPVGFQEMGSPNFHRNLASSMESLSSINQELHWKLQQQRLSMFGNEKENSDFSLPLIESVIQKPPQPILFHNLDVSSSKEEEACNRKDGKWFFDASIATTSSRNANENINNWSGLQGWNDFP